MVNARAERNDRIAGRAGWGGDSPTSYRIARPNRHRESGKTGATMRRTPFQPRAAFSPLRFAPAPTLTTRPAPARETPMPFDLDARLDEWRKALLDTTKRNRLVKFEAGRVGGVALVRPTADLWARLVRDGEQLTFVWKRDLLGLPQEVLNAETLSADFDPASGQSALNEEAVRRDLLELSLKSQRLKAEHLLTDMTDRHLAARLLRLKRTSDEAQSDHGVTTLYAAFGFLRWYESNESQEEIRAPLLLVPVKLARETVEAPFTLVAEEDDILPNHCLAELLRAQFRLALPDATWLDPEDPECLPKYLDAVRAAVQKDYPRWDAVADTALGVFNFQKLAMWEDLGRNEDRVKAHALCRAVAGDSAVSLAPPADLPAAAQLDEVVPPAQAVHILDADSSQHEVIEAVKRGAHVVMDGPPGTGKSQTIANMIAEALSAGKTVLFVSEKTAALDVVKRRLDARGVGDFCLELHSHKANKRDVVAELGRCLDLGRVGAPDDSAALAALTESRRALNEFVAALHEVRAPLGWSAYRAHGEVAKLDAAPARSRVAVPDAATAPMSALQQRCDALARLADCKPVLDNPTGHPWRGCTLDSFAHEAKDDARFHLDRLAKAIPAALSAVVALNAAGVAVDAPSVPAWDAAVADARALLALPLFPADWFAGDPRAAAQRAVDLQRATDEARELTAKVPEFDRGAVTAPGTNLAALDGVAAERERLTAGSVLALRARLSAVKQGATDVRALEARASALDGAARAAAGALGLPQVPELGRLAEVARLCAVIARTGSGPRGWWDAGRRKELLAAVTRADAHDRAAQAARTDLLARLAPAAFAPESSAVARDAAHAGRSFLSRLLPRWWRLKAQVTVWFAVAPASGAAIRADLVALAAYHQNADAARQIATAYSAEVLKYGDRVLWADTADALRTADAHAGLGANSDAFARTDRAAIGTASDALRAALAAFDVGAAALARSLVLPDQSSRGAGAAREWLAG
ncbi:MAG: DUF4011 domain-containing protein, partial [Planctomycetes bacterium]|nr:DUF4011 domain-containing protein [Planctomycetota bacterium]